MMIKRYANRETLSCEGGGNPVFTNYYITPNNFIMEGYMLSRKDISNKLNIDYSKIIRVFKELNITGTNINGKAYYTNEDYLALKGYMLSNHTLPSDAVLIRDTDYDYITPRGEVYKKNKSVYYKVKPFVNLQGYLVCGINYKDGRKNQRIHRLVATYFLDNPENKEFVNHKNGIKTDNHVDNLEWCTGSENMIHATKTGLLVNAKGFEDSQSKPVKMFDKYTNEFIHEFGSMREAARETGIDLSTIYHQVHTNCMPRKHKVYFRYSNK